MSRWTYIFLLSALFLAAFAAAPPKVYPKPWKLCGDEKCSEILFTTKVERTLTGTHELFLNGLVEGQEVHVVAIKFSNRPDIMEAMTADGQRGIIMDATVNKSPYAEFLRTAIEAQKSLKIISQDKNDIGEKRVFGALEAHQDLVRDYNVVARRVAAELGQPAPTELPVPEPPSAKGHGHSHGGHGHSHGGHGHAHDGGHGHSHETGHAHSHDPPANQQAVPTPAPAAPVASANAVPPVASALPTTEGSGAAQQQPPVDATAPVASNIAPEATQPVVSLDNTVENANVPVDAVPVPVEKVPVQPPTPPTAVPLPDDVANNADGTTNGVEEPVLDVEAEIERLLNRDLELMQKRKDAANAAKAAATVAEQPVQLAPVVNAAEPNLAAAEPALAQPKVADPVVMPHLSLNMLGKRFAENSQEAPNAEVPSGDAVPASPTPVVPNENAAPEVADSAPEVTLPPLTLSSSNIPPSDPVPAAPLPVSDSVPTTPSPVQPFENAPHLEATNIPPVVEPVVTTPSPVPTEIPTFTDAVPDIPVTTTPHPVHVRGERDSLPATDIPENFCYGDDCKNVKPLEGQIEEAVPSTTAAPMIPDDPVQPQEPAPNPVEENKESEIPSLHKTAGNFGDVETMARIQPPTATGPSLMGRTVRAICDGVRSSVPGTGDLSDGGVGIVLNVTVLLIAATMYLVGSMLSDGDTELFERKAAHDLATRYKALQAQLKERNEQLSRMQHLGGQAQQAHALLQENEQLRHDIGNMRIMYGELEAKYTSEGADKQSLETDLARLREELSASRDHEAELERRFAAVRAAHDDTQAQVAEAREQMKEMELRLKEAVRQKETLNGEVNKAQSKVVEFEVDMRQLKVENQTLNAQRDDLEVRNVQLEEMFANTQQKLNEVLAAKKEEKPTATDAATGGSAGGSNGGSNGWSDLEEFDEHDHSSSQTQQSSHARKVSPVSAAAPAALAVSEIQEVARLRGEIKRLELRVESAKNELDKELVIKESLEGKIHMLEEEVRDKSRRVEESDSENRRTNQRCDKLLQLVEEANAKLRETETTCNKLRDEMRRMQDEARQLEDDRRKKEERLKETENDLKKLRNDHLKLETKQFNLIREHKAMLDQQALGSGPSSELLSGLGPSGAERLSAGSRSGGGLLRDLAYEPLWDEPPLIPQHRRTTSPDDFDFMPEAMPQIRRNSRSRRSERREPSPSDQERRRTPKEGIVHRRRSRSQGRHPFSAYHDMPFLGSATHRPLLPTRPESHTGGSIGSVGMGGHVYYSSGGSNSGRSPPPEMPAQSAVPPAGVHKPKGKRAVDLNAAFK